jgi:hypothetical protein
MKQLRQLLFFIPVFGLALVSPERAAAQIPVTDALSNLQLTIQNAKWVQELAQGLRIYNNAVQTYGVASQEASYLRSKQVLLAVGFLAQHAMIPGQTGWDRALTSVGCIANSAAVWQQMTAPGGTNSFLALSNRIKLADSFGTSMLNAIGNCNAAAAQTNGSIGSLEQMASDLSANANTRANQSNLNNMGQTQQLRIQQCQHAMQMQQAQLQMLHAMQQRDQDQAVLNMDTQAAAIQSQITLSNTVNDIHNVIDR